MTKRNIGNEIITGLEEIKAWKRGEAKLRTFTVELPRAADVPHIRNGESEEEGILQGTLKLEACYSTHARVYACAAGVPTAQAARDGAVSMRR